MEDASIRGVTLDSALVDAAATAGARRRARGPRRLPARVCAFSEAAARLCSPRRCTLPVARSTPGCPPTPRRLSGCGAEKRAMFSISWRFSWRSEPHLFPTCLPLSYPQEEKKAMFSISWRGADMGALWALAVQPAMQARAVWRAARADCLRSAGASCGAGWTACCSTRPTTHHHPPTTHHLHTLPQLVAYGGRRGGCTCALNIPHPTTVPRSWWRMNGGEHGAVDQSSTSNLNHHPPPAPCSS